MSLLIVAGLVFIFGIVVLIIAIKEKGYEMLLGGLALIFAAVVFVVLLRLLGYVS